MVCGLLTWCNVRSRVGALCVVCCFAFYDDAVGEWDTTIDRGYLVQIDLATSYSEAHLQNIKASLEHNGTGAGEYLSNIRGDTLDILADTNDMLLLLGDVSGESLQYHLARIDEALRLNNDTMVLRNINNWLSLHLTPSVESIEADINTHLPAMSDYLAAVRWSILPETNQLLTDLLDGQTNVSSGVTTQEPGVPLPLFNPVAGGTEVVMPDYYIPSLTAPSESGFSIDVDQGGVSAWTMDVGYGYEGVMIPFRFADTQFQSYMSPFLTALWVAMALWAFFGVWREFEKK